MFNFQNVSCTIAFVLIVTLVWKPNKYVLRRMAVRMTMIAIAASIVWKAYFIVAGIAVHAMARLGGVQ